MLTEIQTASIKACEHLDCLQMKILFGELNTMKFSDVLKIGWCLDFFVFIHGVWREDWVMEGK